MLAAAAEKNLNDGGLTFLVAAFAALIAFGQWWTARQKLAFDLFEKRFQVFTDIRLIYSEAVQTGKIVEHKDLIDDVKARALFLFEGEVTLMIEKFYELTVELEAGKLGVIPKMNEAYTHLVARIGRYIAMTQKPPRIPW